MSISSPQLPSGTLCDTSVIRIYTLVDRLDILSVSVDAILAPAAVFDPDENIDAPPGVLLSELAKSQSYWSSNSDNARGMQNWSRLRQLWQRTDIGAIHMTEDEMLEYEDLTSTESGLGFKIGRGEAAVLAIASSRLLEAAIDESAARETAANRYPDLMIVTSRDLLRRAVVRGHLSTPEADIVYADMLDANYRGPFSLWSD